MDFFLNLFSSEFMPHGHCFQWRPDILWTHVISDGVIALSYATIPATLAVFTAKRKDLQFRGVFILFALFILFCGATHAFQIYAVWEGAYRLTGLMKAMTAVVSLTTAVVLAKMVPVALKIPSPQQLRDANLRLKDAHDERIKAEKELSEQRKETLFRTIFAATPNGMALLDHSGRFLLANRAFGTMFGVEEVKVVGLSAQQVMSETVATSIMAYLDNHLAEAHHNDPLDRTIIECQAQPGRLLVAEVGFSPVEYKGDDLVIATFVDISQRRADEEALRRAKHRFERAVTGTRDGLWDWRLEDDQVWFSPHFCGLLGIEPNQENNPYSLAAWLSHAQPATRGALERALRNLADQEGGTLKQEHLFKTASGEYRWFETRARFSSAEHSTFVSGSISDIHPRKLVEMELEKQNVYLETILDNMRHGIFVIDVTEEQDFVFSAFNRAEEEMTGVSFEDAKNKRVEDLVPKYFPIEVAREIRARYQACYDRKGPYQYTEMLPLQGKETWWLTNLSPIVDESGQVTRIIGSTSEITQVKQLEQSMREREEFLQKVIDFSLNGLYIFNFQTRRNTFINPAYTRITGYEMQDLAAMEGNLTQLFHPESTEPLAAHIQEVLQSEAGQSTTMEYRFRHKNGHWIWCLSSDTVFSRDGDGKPVEMIGTFIDISSIKLANQRLRESNQELEQFAFVASHDLREPLRKVKSFGKLITKRYAENLPEKAADYFERMMSATDRMDRLIEDLLSLSRVATQQRSFEHCSLNAVLDQVLSDLSLLIKRKEARIERGALPGLFCDQLQMYQLFANLVGNSLKYTRTDVKPLIQIRLQSETPDRVVIEVCDNGIGYDGDASEQIFGIFKRLHGRDDYPGSGIGLAICRKIVERHEGTISAQGEPGKGARFVVSLPRR
ncbi:PAS domain S-box protein [Acanthopleuribacter pedis]|uniref:histidine kinase n=1 Tax=Acanthopleuribacter pedis TaxID=442870 RepID=A0A8J7Q9Q2_9BACT|nr:PAS domain S-box protein [Acanthopleuribacter pedis]MBO1322702.1 PAS domain S-box protein [Acanthopleuribacter pedis]